MLRNAELLMKRYKKPEKIIRVCPREIIELDLELGYKLDNFESNPEILKWVLRKNASVEVLLAIGHKAFFYDVSQNICERYGKKYISHKLYTEFCIKIQQKKVTFKIDDKSGNCEVEFLTYEGDRSK